MGEICSQTQEGGTTVHRNKIAEESANLEYYRVFYEVATTGSVSDAAKELGVSKPAVSQQLRLLEKSLGYRLFDRRGRGVRLRREGAMLYDYVQRAFGDIEKGEQQLKLMKVLDGDEVRIGASDMALRSFLQPYLTKYHESHEEIRVRVMREPKPGSLKLLQNGEADFDVVSAPLSVHPSQVDLQPVKEVRDVFIAGKRYAYLRGQTISLRKLKELPLICMEENSSSRLALDTFLRAHYIVTKPEFELRTGDDILDFTERGFGVGFVAEDFAREAIREGSVFEITFNHRMPLRQVSIATMEGRVIPWSARRLLSMIREGVLIEEETG